jgi:hypothetical protein
MTGPERAVAVTARIDQQLAELAGALDEGIAHARTQVDQHGDVGAIVGLRAEFDQLVDEHPAAAASSLAAAMVRLARQPTHTAGLGLPAQYVQPGWSYQLGDQWYPVVDTGDAWHDCTEEDCVALGFDGDVAGVLAELFDDDADADANEPDGHTWLHMHAADTVQVRIPCERPS